MAESMCPATMCPYLGLEEDGSPWTGERDSECETECGWHGDGGCIVPADLASELLMDVDGIPDGEWPACPRSDECQWQQQCGDNPCPPRLAVMLNEDPERCMF